MYLAWLNELDGTHWPEELQAYTTGNDIEHTPDIEHIPHALSLYQAVLDLHAKVVVELGTRLYKSARIIIEALKQTGGHLYTIDNQSYPSLLRQATDDVYVTAVLADTRLVEWTMPIDLLFSDASHGYQETMAELDKFWPLVNIPGLAIVADIDSHFSAKRAVTDWGEKNQCLPILDLRGQGAAYFLKPVYERRCRDRTGVDSWVTTKPPA